MIYIPYLTFVFKLLVAVVSVFLVLGSYKALHIHQRIISVACLCREELMSKSVEAKLASVHSVRTF